MQGFLTLMFGVFIGAGTLWIVTPEPSPTLCKQEEKEVVKYKLSLNGICHSEESQYFDYIKYFTPYDSISECITDGGRLPVNQ